MPAHPAQRREVTRAELLSMTDRLAAEFAGRLAPGTVERCVYRSREELLGAGVRDDIVVATERTVRKRLRDLVGAHVG